MQTCSIKMPPTLHRRNKSWLSRSESNHRERIIACCDTGEEGLGVNESIDLSLALLTAAFEVSLDPCAVGANGLGCVAFCILVIILLLEELLIVVHPLLEVSELCLGAGLCLLLGVESVLQSSVLLQVLILCIAVVSPTLRDFLLGILNEHLEDGDDAARFALASTVVAVSKAGIWGLVLILCVLRSLLDELWDIHLVALVEGAQGGN